MENIDVGQNANDIKNKTDKLICEIAVKLEKMRTLDYVFFVEHPYKRIWHNFVNGIARGVGSAIGFSVVFALIIMILEWIGNINLPIVSEIVRFILSLAQK